MKTIKAKQVSIVNAGLALVIACTVGMMSTPSFASGGGPGGNGGGGGGGGVQTPTFSGNWSDTIKMPFGTGAFTMAISQSQSLATRNLL